MPTFSQITNQSDGYRKLPQVSRDALQMLWHSDYWDGPKSGLLVFNDERCWFEMVAENEDEDLIGWYRRFVIVRLSPAQLKEEEGWHDLFCEKVGWHTDFQTELPGFPQSKEESLRPRELWPEFYERYQQRVPLNLSDNEVLAWFEH